MKRLTSKEVSKMMEEVNQLAELTNPVMPSAVRDEARKKLKAQGKTDAEIDKLFADMDAAAQARLNPTPEQRKAQVERDRLIQQAGGGVAGEKAATERLKNNPLRFLFDIEARGRADVRTKGREALRQLGDGDIEKGLEIFRAEQEKRNNTNSSSPESSSSSSSSSSNTVPAGSFNTSPKGSTRRNEVEAQIKRDNAARTDDQRVQPRTAPKPQLTDQQKVRAEYDRLRNSTDPKERAQAVTYGRQMAAAGASKSNFSGYQSASDAQKNLPAPAARTSMAQRLQAIRDMRAASQSRIAAQGGTPATSAAKPTPKVAPPAVNPNQQSSIQQKVAKVKQPVQPKTQPVQPKVQPTGVRNPTRGPITVDDKVSGTSNTYQSGQRMSGADSSLVGSMQSQIRSNQVPTGNTIKTQVNPDSSIQVTQKRDPKVTAKIKKSLDI